MPRAHRSETIHFSALAALALAGFPCLAQQPPNCGGLPNAEQLRTAVQSVVKEGPSKNGGMGNQEWAAVVNRDGMVCAIVFSGTKRGDQWPGSRVIAASKASTANALSGANYALSTANLYAAAQPGGSLYGLANSAPPNPQAVFGNPSSFGTSSDPMVGKAIGGVVVFGGGLALYSSRGNIVGGLGLSGDTACTDHVIAWKVRHQLQLDAVPMGPSPAHNDNMILDWTKNYSPSGFGHPSCKGGTSADYIINGLSKQFPTGPRRK
ncbi:MAG TPA: heme-binding protein [Bryobacteraceae bacterium]|nr:heme-binding protein [Bryobacteraceae bacterium]